MEKINKIQWSKPTERKIHDEEIMLQCYYNQERAVSVELIHHLLGGPNMEYQAMSVEESFECFKFCADHLVDYLKKSSSDILFFEHRDNTTSNIMVVVTKQKCTNSTRGQPVLFAVIRLTVMLTPCIGFCHYFKLKGQFFSLF